MRKIDYEIIVRYFNGECDNNEKQQIIHWANEAEEHARQLFEWEEMYFLGKRANETEQRKTQEAEERLFTRIREHEKNGRKTFRLRTWVKYAAAVALLFTSSGLGMWYFTHLIIFLLLFHISQRIRLVHLPHGKRQAFFYDAAHFLLHRT